jgi:hypothetical protein
MSAIEVIEQIKRLPGDEQQKVVEWVRQPGASDSAIHGRQTVVSEDFKRLAGEVFSGHADLFRKLAQ